jgi:hypothetical protein
MVSRMRKPVPGTTLDQSDLLGPIGADSQVRLPHPLAFNIEIHAADGALLVHLFERDGKLICEADKERLDEGAKAFLYHMLQWSGQIGIRWKDDVKAAVEGQ